MSSEQNKSIADALKSAIGAQLNALIAEGISIRTLEKIQRFCAAMRQALHAIEAPDTKLKARFNNIIGGVQLAPMSDDEVGYEVDSGAYATAPNIETYGANMPRQLMAMMSKLGDKLGPKPSAKDMIDAILTAEEAKKPELAEMLRQRFVETFGPEPKGALAQPAAPAALPASTNGAASPQNGAAS